MKLPIHREGWIFVAVFALANALLFLFAGGIGWIGVPFTLWCIAFFRDPERAAPQAPGLILSPADGKLLPIVQAAPPAELGMGEAPRRRLSIFMNVFDVHVNRVPIGGMVVGLAYRPGRFFNASFDKASAHNERMSIRLRPGAAADRPEGTGEEGDLAVVQIAGLVARRIICEIKAGQEVRRGARFGMIRFGSRLDVYLPPGAVVLAEPGQRVKAGETVLAKFAPMRLDQRGSDR